MGLIIQGPNRSRHAFEFYFSEQWKHIKGADTARCGEKTGFAFDKAHTFFYNGEQIGGGQ